MENSVEQDKRKVRVIEVDDRQLRAHVSEVVRQRVRRRCRGFWKLRPWARHCGARRHPGRALPAVFSDNGGEVQLGVPKLRHIPFETAIIGRYRHRESSVEEALVEMYLAGGSGRKAEDITEALWGSVASPSTISDLNQKISSAWRFGASVRLSENTPIFCGRYLAKRAWGGKVVTVSVFVAFGGRREGYREVLGLAERSREDRKSWRGFLRHPKARGLERIWLPVSDKGPGLLEALYE